MAAKEQSFKGKNCRFYVKYGTWVSSDGSVVGYTTNEKDQWGLPYKKFHSLRVHHDDICAYIEHPWNGQFRLDMAVMKCFGPPLPGEGEYMINHKDGNIQNCNKYNLEWVPYQYRPNTANSIRIDYMGNKLKVCKDGTFWEGAEQLIVCDVKGDEDTNTLRIVAPFIPLRRRGSIYPYSQNVDELMAAASYVQGDKLRLKDPVILHKDYDRMNFTSENLEWVERDDVRYAGYLKQKEADRRTRWQEENPGMNINKAPYSI